MATSIGQQSDVTALRILAAVPTFLVSDVGGTARWYAAHLGFEIAGTFPDNREVTISVASLTSSSRVL